MSVEQSWLVASTLVEVAAPVTNPEIAVTG